MIRVCSGLVFRNISLIFIIFLPCRKVKFSYHNCLSGLVFRAISFIFIIFLPCHKVKFSKEDFLAIFHSSHFSLNDDLGIWFGQHGQYCILICMGTNSMNRVILFVALHNPPLRNKRESTVEVTDQWPDWPFQYHFRQIKWFVCNSYLSPWAVSCMYPPN